MSLDNTQCIKGFLACFVVFHHLYQNTSFLKNVYIVNDIFNSLGYMAVAGFFFFTGYGLMISYQKKGLSYIKSMPLKRIFPLYINYVILIGMYFLYEQFVLQTPIRWTVLLLSFGWGGTIVDNAWYIQTSFVIYGVVFGVFLLFKNDKHKVLSFTAAMLMYTIYCIVTKCNTIWYQGVFTVSLGMLWAMHRHRIDAFLHKKYWIALIGSIVLLVFFFSGSICPQIGVNSIKVLCRMAVTLSFTTSMILLVQKIPVSNFATRFLGKYAFEIYVMQGFAMSFFHSKIFNIANDFLYVAVCLVVTLFLAIVIHPLFSFINKKAKGISKKNPTRSF